MKTVIFNPTLDKVEDVAADMLSAEENKKGSFGVLVDSRETLAGFSKASLASMNNAIERFKNPAAPNLIKSFSDKSAGVARVFAAIQSLPVTIGEEEDDVTDTTQPADDTVTMRTPVQAKANEIMKESLEQHAGATMTGQDELTSDYKPRLISEITAEEPPVRPLLEGFPEGAPQKEGPTRDVWLIAHRLTNEGKGRKEVIAECESVGINKSTAATQYQRYMTARKAQEK